MKYVICDKCGHNMEPDLRNDIMLCTNCNWGSREWVKIYKLVLELQKQNIGFKEEDFSL